MSITIITGESGTGKTLIANALRNNQISNQKGCLLIDETQDGALDTLLEKIIVGVNLPHPDDMPIDLNLIPWKTDPMIILVGEKQSMLADIEARVPGFTDKFGPVYEIHTVK